MPIEGAVAETQVHARAIDEAAYVLEKHGHFGETVLLMKAQQTRSSAWRRVYMLAREILRERREV